MEAHPVDEHVIDLALLRKRMTRLFARDGIVCEDELDLIRDFDTTHRMISQFRLRQKAGETFALCGDTIHTRRLFRENDLVLMDELEARRRGMRLRARSEDEPQDAA